MTSAPRASEVEYHRAFAASWSATRSRTGSSERIGQSIDPLRARNDVTPAPDRRQAAVRIETRKINDTARVRRPSFWPVDSGRTQAKDELAAASRQAIRVCWSRLPRLLVGFGVFAIGRPGE